MAFTNSPLVDYTRISPNTPDSLGFTFISKFLLSMSSCSLLYLLNIQQLFP